jgi:sigma54-dependent transcription regulator
MICGTVARRTRSHEKRIQQQKKLERTSSAEAVKLGPEGAVLSDAAKKIEAIVLSRHQRK